MFNEVRKSLKNAYARLNSSERLRKISVIASATSAVVPTATFTFFDNCLHENAVVKPIFLEFRFFWTFRELLW